MMDGETINLIVVYNPLDTSDRALERLVWFRKKALSAYLEGLPDGVTWAVCLNAEPIEQSLWAETYPAPDDFITIMPIMEGGGGGGKSVMRIVAMIAVAVVAAYTGGAAAAMYGAGMMGPTIGGATLDVAMAGGTIGSAISVGVGALVPPPASLIVALLPQGIAL